LSEIHVVDVGSPLSLSSVLAVEARRAKSEGLAKEVRRLDTDGRSVHHRLRMDNEKTELEIQSPG
jgi:hypothetical protein